jgi:uncharacterized membrane protein
MAGTALSWNRSARAANYPAFSTSLSKERISSSQGSAYPIPGLTMKQALSSLTRWVMAGALAGLAMSATAQRHGFVEHDGTFSVFDVPGAGFSQTSDINNAGHIVGSFNDAQAQRHGFLRVGSHFTTIDVPGGSGTTAFGINDAGTSSESSLTASKYCTVTSMSEEGSPRLMFPARSLLRQMPSTMPDRFLDCP